MYNKDLASLYQKDDELEWRTADGNVFVVHVSVLACVCLLVHTLWSTWYNQMLTIVNHMLFLLENLSV